MTGGWTVTTRIYQLRWEWYSKTLSGKWCDSWFLTELMKLMTEERQQHITKRPLVGND